ncbi:peptidyl-prolyl cis-trans isomerase [Sporosarcina sp. HYO08]|uniref:peptidylprolyl isomerase n=1 Tax=Sporosarcina sp. HYO08 TaxID=1759557 RepID=UPI0007966E30|nr:peptidyl-prolyl cis-trans isomerase [Sporosarcina sp. HYO08]KXH86809.1 foldase [Sporosarcina sp. HYO08]
MKYGRAPKAEAQEPPKRRLKTKPLLILIAILLVTNLLWFIGWLIPDPPKIAATNEEVASVAGVPITREEWMSAMEKEVGREVLLDLVNDKVMEAAAKQYGIDVSDKEIDLELALIRSMDGQSYSGIDAEKMRQNIRANLILEKVLTKDVVIKDKAVKDYYKENASLYNTLTAYRISMIIVPTKKEAEQAMEELAKGSSFDALAKERSVDFASASLGGDIGYVNEATKFVDSAIFQAAANTKKGDHTDAVKLSNGTYAIVQVNDMIEGQSFTYQEVKDHVRREIALEQLSQSVTPEAFWQEFNATWFYGK